jgi:hypothetical protein
MADTTPKRWMCFYHLRETCTQCALFDGQRIRGTDSIVMEAPVVPTRFVFRCKS